MAKPTAPIPTKLMFTVQATADIAAYPGTLLQQALVVFGDESNEGQLIEYVAIPWFQIIRELNRDPEFLFKVPWRKMEELIAGAYDQAGCPEVLLTPRSNDGGRDVIATWPGIGSIRTLDQVKAYAPNRKVTAEEIRAMLGVLSAEQNVSKGIVTTTSTFAPGILKDPRIAAFMPYRLELGDGDVLRNWLKSLLAKNEKG